MTRRFFGVVAVAMVLHALVVSLAAATSALAEADAVAAATINADRSPDTLLGKNMRRDLSGSAPELGEAATAPRELRGKKCNPKKDTSCCRVEAHVFAKQGIRAAIGIDRRRRHGVGLVERRGRRGEGDDEREEHHGDGDRGTPKKRRIPRVFAVSAHERARGGVGLPHAAQRWIPGACAGTREV